MRLVAVASCSLNQWALDFDGNARRIRESIRLARASGAAYRLGPELEIPGYGCEDHFMEMDTIDHSWAVLASLLADGSTDGMLCDVGMPVMHRGVRYNCRVFCLDGRILLIRPKVSRWRSRGRAGPAALCRIHSLPPPATRWPQLHLADDGNYREPRWFTAWPASRRDLEDCFLPEAVTEVAGQASAPFGCGVISSADGISVASETCEELFTPRSPHIALSLDGVDIIGNGSGSHHELRKLHKRVDLIRSATSKGGGVYVYANQQGCDGGRLYYDGCALVACNGAVVAQGSQFGVSEVEVVTAVVDVDAVRSFRMAIASRSVQAMSQPMAERVPAPGLRMVRRDSARQAPTAPLDERTDGDGAGVLISTPRAAPGMAPASAAGRPAAAPEPSRLTPYGAIGPGGVRYLSPEEEIARGPACWLWDYLRTSGARGYFLPLSGGADSAATAAIAAVMCEMVCEAIEAGDEGVAADCRRVVGLDKAADGSPWLPRDGKELCGLLLHTSYMGSSNSSSATRDRAAALASQLGSYHVAVSIDSVLAAIVAVLAAVMGGRTPSYSSRGGSRAEDLALQNLQARIRMVLAYAMAQLLPWFRGAGGGAGGFLLVLGSANVDEALRGYMTKYDCSAADINPIGGVAKLDLRRFLRWAAGASGYGWTVLGDIAGAPPTAELQPMAEGAAEHSQTDEEDMGMTYAELRRFGNLRKLERCGPVSMCRRLLAEWSHLPASEVGRKVKAFWRFHTLNRHKCTVLTPSYHAEAYSPDDNRFDLRPFLYRSLDAQNRAIDELVASLDGAADA